MGWTFARKWGSQGTGNGQFSWFCDLCVYGDQVFVVEDDNNRVQAFGLDGTFRYKWGAAGVGNGQFDQPTGIAAYGNEIYVLDALNNRIQVFNLVGVYQRQWGSAGAGDGQFSFSDTADFGLSRLTVSNGEVYVADNGNRRVQVFNTAGVFQRKWAAPAMSGVFVYAGEVYLLTWGPPYIQVYNTAGVPQRGLVIDGSLLDGGQGIYVNAEGIYVACDTADVVRVFDSATGDVLSTPAMHGSGDGQVDAPMGVFRYGTELYVYDFWRVQVFGYTASAPVGTAIPGAYYDGIFTGGSPL